MPTYKASPPMAFKSSIQTSLKNPEKQKLCSPPSKSFSAKKQPIWTKGQSLTHHNCTISDTVHTTYIYMSVHTYAHTCVLTHTHTYTCFHPFIVYTIITCTLYLCVHTMHMCT